MIKAFHNRLGLVDLNVLKVDAAVNDYDERLYLERHKETGDWVVMITMERPSDPYPVLGFKDLPDPRTVVQKLRESDSQREDIRQRIMQYNKAKDRELDHKIQENVGAGAEALEYISRKEGKVSEYKSYRKVKPKKK